MATQPSSSPWIKFWQPRAHARLRLFCFPYVGGGASLFQVFPKYLHEDIEVWSVQLPGRESRFAEAPYSRLEDLIEALENALSPYLDVSYAFFGHSMGALISFELTRALRRRGKVPFPIHLFVSAHRTPQLPPTMPPVHKLSDAAILERLQKINGTSEEIFKHPELMELLIPLFRADFMLCETYSYVPEAPLDCSLSAFGGLQDEAVTYESIKDWQSQTTGSFQTHFFPGDHFFFLKETERAALLWLLSQEILRDLQKA